MNSVLKVTARRLAGPMVLAAVFVLPAAADAAPAKRSPLLATNASLAGPLRILASFGTTTSVWRSAAHNRRVGGMPNSYHLVGRAIDVQRRPGVTHAMVDAALRKAGFLPIESIDEIDHSHFAFLPPNGSVRSPKLEAVVAAVPAKRPEPRLAADVHGTLLIDSAGLAPAGPTIVAAAGSAPLLGAAD